ncbi:hypothetical protein BGZ63DRAFT_403182 [Mariannaea sp. PMI_226]|nr:hypothetical protein BGZ63DRAFT_403182 [Mariannaea sp. PMI_226]
MGLGRRGRKPGNNHKSPYHSLTTAVSQKSLTGKTVLITGAGRGAGEHIAHEVAAVGAKRIGISWARQSPEFASRDKFAKAFPQKAFEAFTPDITDEAAIATVFKSFGTPHVLINNAGVFPDDGPFVTQRLKEWWSGFEINILGTAIVTQQFLKAKARDQIGLVLNVSIMAVNM